MTISVVIFHAQPSVSIFSFPPAVSAIDECYTDVNTRGFVDGHCGHNDTHYIPCEEKYTVWNFVSRTTLVTWYVLLCTSGMLSVVRYNVFQEHFRLLLGLEQQKPFL